MLYLYAYVFLVEGKVSGLAEDDMNNKLQMMVTTVYTMRAAIGNLKDDYNALKTNITKLSNMTRYQEFNTNIETLSTWAEKYTERGTEDRLFPFINNVSLKITVFRDVTPCSLTDQLQTFQRKLLPPFLPWRQQPSICLLHPTSHFIVN